MASSHRPYPIAGGLWVSAQRWQKLLFMHWEVDANLLRSLVPSELELDSYEGRHFVGVVPFEMNRVRARFLPWIPVLSKFPELNVRSYVRYKGQAGVYFFSLDASRAIFVWGGRRFYDLPYFKAQMNVSGNLFNVRYSSIRQDSRSSGPAEFLASYEAQSESYLSKPGSLDAFLTERYCLFTKHAGQVKVAEIDHQQWPLRHARATAESNRMTESLGLPLKGEPLLHFVDKIDVKIWPLRPAFGTPQSPIVFFDGVCGLCNRTVDFALRWDEARVLRFSPLQGETAKSLLPNELTSRLKSIVVVTSDGKILQEASAVLYMLQSMPSPLSLLAYLGQFVPDFLLRWIYRGIAKFRYRVFGKQSVCRLPSPQERELFLP